MIGIGIVSFNRPHYLTQLLASLEAQVDVPALSWHLFQDGAVNKFSGREVGDQDHITEAVKTFFAAHLPGEKIAHVRADNVGIGINQFEAYELMCQHYDRIVMLEDDVILSPYWARLLPMLFDGLEQHPDVFGFVTGFKRWCERGEIEAYLDRVAPGAPHWWMIGFTPDRWERIKPHFWRYYELIQECDYGHLPHGRILELFKEVGWNSPVSSQDGGKSMAVHLAGMHRVQLTVNRGISIGREGVHFKGGLFERMGLHEQEPYVFESDRTRERFEWV
jgi:hypothetical protein